MANRRQRGAAQRQLVVGVDFGGVIVGGGDDGSKQEDTTMFSDNYLQTPRVEGSFEAVAWLVSLLGPKNVHIVSKAREKMQEKSRAWMAHHGFYEATGFARKNVHFCRERRDKADVCRGFGVTCLVDDRKDCLTCLDDSVTARYLFPSTRSYPQSDGDNVVVVPSSFGGCDNSGETLGGWAWIRCDLESRMKESEAAAAAAKSKPVTELKKYVSCGFLVLRPMASSTRDGDDDGDSGGAGRDGACRADLGLELLLLKHRHRYDLPKGHVEEGEEHIETAYRELMEETGIKRTEIKRLPGFMHTSTYHPTYKRAGGEKVEKSVHIFMGVVSEGCQIEPRNLTEHQGFEWFPWDRFCKGKSVPKRFSQFASLFSAAGKHVRRTNPDIAGILAGDHACARTGSGNRVCPIEAVTAPP
eukprot:TRINITY_DN13604_c0_g1_i1.p1 TRINITY_DN13604_c0_g1~~TRINITY_DN13604_c0_g1_i1.p1  ORF type:complete len:414 (-),score=91.78 TRINITY_DN13604_c0_g1_i1:152-1393(-)